MGSRSKAKKSLKGDRVKDKKKPGKKAKPGSETSGTISSSTAKYDEKRKKDGGIANPKLPVTITTVLNKGPAVNPATTRMDHLAANSAKPATTSAWSHKISTAITEGRTATGGKRKTFSDISSDSSSSVSSSDTSSLSSSSDSEKTVGSNKNNPAPHTKSVTKSTAPQKTIEGHQAKRIKLDIEEVADHWIQKLEAMTKEMKADLKNFKSH